jgi:DNA-nicking Smr family endonuclease
MPRERRLVRKHRSHTGHPDPFDPLDGVPLDTLDLHGFRSDEATAHFDQYLTRLQKRSPGALVHVITGKGRNSPNGPVLRSVIKRAIAADGGRRVAAWARDEDDGGYLVRLKGGQW